MYNNGFILFLSAGIEYPVKISQIPRFEKQNSIRINVFGYDESEKNTHIFPRYVSEFDFDKTVNLLLISNEMRSHYILIKDLDALLRDRTKHHGGMKFCLRCLQCFSTKVLLESHIKMCSRKKIQKTVMPTDTLLKFSNYKYKEPNTITIYADFEALLVPYKQLVGRKTQLTHKHVPCGYGYTVVSPHTHLNKPVKIYRGEDCADRFIIDMLKEYEEVKDILNGNVPMTFNDKDKIAFKRAKTCSICLKDLDWGDSKNYVVRDHCHVTGRFRSAVHNECNLKLQMQRRLVIIFHNGKGYDFHFLIESLAKFTDVSEIDVIANTTEKFTRIKTPNFVFHDSLNHLSTSLDELAKNLRDKGEEYFPLIKAEFPKRSQFKAALTKGIYCYNYMTDFSKFDERIPDAEAFYNDLTDEELSDTEYARLEYMCRLYKIATLGDLHDHYLKVCSTYFNLLLYFCNNLGYLFFYVIIFA